MGLFDVVHTERAEFQCSEGHDLNGEEFQTKDLGRTMGTWAIADVIDGTPGGYGDPPRRPLLARLFVYATCERCPAFVQANTFNLCPCGVEFEVEVVDDVVRAIRRVSPSTAEWLESEPKEAYMVGCYGPMPFAEAERMHQTRMHQTRS